MSAFSSPQTGHEGMTSKISETESPEDEVPLWFLKTKKKFGHGLIKCVIWIKIGLIKCVILEYNRAH
jgi:hypothetical protein